MTIQIHDLTEHQRILLDTMWEKKTSEELYTWMETITDNNLRTVEVLIELVQLAYLDNQVNCTSDLSLAENLIKKVQKRC